MVSTGSVAASCGYVVTEIGRAAALDPGRCQCQYEIDGSLLKCSSCGTVYSMVRGNPSVSRPKSRARD